MQPLFSGMLLQAPAKINLSLRVLGRRPDGFHEIESLMAPLSLVDEIEINRTETGGIELVCDDPRLPPGEGNLAYRAAKLFCERTGAAPHLKIALSKKIPHGAGLGGGSSDAAAVLLGLNTLPGAGLPLEEIALMAAELGSDVPFFTCGTAAVCRGRGEQVCATALERRLHLVLFKPPFGVPTPWAYSRWKDSRELPGISYGPQAFAWGTLVNDLERPVFEKYLFLAHLKRWLLEQGEVEGALMSGSGSTVFAVLKEESEGEPLAARAAGAFGDIWTRLCHTL